MPTGVYARVVNSVVKNESKNEKHSAALTKSQAKHSALAIKKTAVLQKRAEALLAKTTNANAKARIREALVKMKATTKAHNVHAGKISKNAPHLASEIIQLRTKKFFASRPLTQAEGKVDFNYVNQCFNDQENALKTALALAISAMIAASLASILNKIKAGDIPGIGKIPLINSNKVEAILNSAMKQSFEAGKNMASKEIGVVRPNTPLLKTQLINMKASQHADDIAQDVDSAGKEEIYKGLDAGLTAIAIIAAATMAAQDQAEKSVDYAEGTVVGENINDGRQLVFQNNLDMIQAFQRSEIIDDRTCPACEEVDEAVVANDDPVADIDELHPNCRGIWVPITNDEDAPEQIGLTAEQQALFDDVE